MAQLMMKQRVSKSIPTAAPHLVFAHGKKEHKQLFYSLADETNSVTSVPDLRGMDCYAPCPGWLVLKEKYSDGARARCFLLNTVSMKKIKLPPIPNSMYYALCVVTSSPPNCLVMFVFYAVSGRFFWASDFPCLFCRPGDRKWIRQSLKPTEDAHYVFRWLDGAVSCNGKTYISYEELSGIAILDTPICSEQTPNTLPVKFLKIERRPRLLLPLFASPNTPLYCVESCGEVFTVIKHYWGGLSNEVHTFSVFKLKSSKVEWEKVKSLGNDRAFLLSGSCSLSVSASEIGEYENSILFFEPGDGRLYTYNLQSQEVSNIRVCPSKLVTLSTKPYWMVPGTV